MSETFAGKDLDEIPPHAWQSVDKSQCFPPASGLGVFGGLRCLGFFDLGFQGLGFSRHRSRPQHGFKQKGSEGIQSRTVLGRYSGVRELGTVLVQWLPVQRLGFGLFADLKRSPKESQVYS